MEQEIPKKYYLLENLTGENPVGLVRALQISPELISLMAKKYGENVSYREVSRETYERAKEERKDKDQNTAKIRFGARSLELASQ
jgi:hypothetical protein